MSEAIVPDALASDAATLATGVPALPPAFTWRKARLIVDREIRSWRSTREDRGEAYLDRLWFEFVTTDGELAVVYFDKHAKRPGERWRLYTLDEAKSD